MNSQYKYVLRELESIKFQYLIRCLLNYEGEWLNLEKG